MHLSKQELSSSSVYVKSANITLNTSLLDCVMKYFLIVGRALLGKIHYCFLVFDETFQLLDFPANKYMYRIPDYYI